MTGQAVEGWADLEEVPQLLAASVFQVVIMFQGIKHVLQNQDDCDWSCRLSYSASCLLVQLSM